MGSRGNIGRSQATPRSSVDFSRIRRPFQGKPTNAVSFGVVGHYDQNPAFARVENNKVLVEVTLMPGGDEVVAELGMEAQGNGFGFYIPVTIGTRVLVAFPGGEEDPIIIKRMTDREYPFPDDVAGVTTQGAPANPLVGSTAAPQWAFMQTPAGTLLAIETGDDGDVVVKSGANIQLEADPGQAIHLNGRVHIGESWTTPPVGASTGPAGEVIPGASSVSHVPTPHIPTPISAIPSVAPAGTPDDGIVRIKDDVQSDTTTDPDFWIYLQSVHAFLVALAAVWNPLATGGGGPFVVPSGSTIPIAPDPPLAIGSRAKSASGNTCAD